ncbi:Ser/Thr protein phosphatase, putative [Trichomonas vaginalis G3]|uniref:Serine/threonine-protein phosphatase n=1 Tax=Trichomonas vaginalis (strain ATCC PRA-98 / G3) TaxID=412133 RepID=A2FNJ9_TRIV3|nr:serine threonine-protein phosphatase family [Trichomonas vaginalis G3]EAX93499.1 Ser/Thr protein phosphatase, putative [Trichomonas vaginalis G3]KAI5511572.1 serine threonine-protein phosphatase family [Trichomonas vaginalis G3]|eukprot:XP_001306429.1 Ser/Thr protein phosphatase [Trichomonas vaginalis G3]
MDLDVDAIIQSIRQGNQVQEQEVVSIMTKLQEVLFNENNVLELSSPIIICGDIHGQLYDLFQLFDTVVPKGIGSTKFLFMGDYVDRGRFSMETFAYLAALKLKYPKQFFLLRGNHECRQVNQAYGFYAETLQNYGHSGIWSLCNEIFDLLPMAALIDNRVFSVHGGLSPKVTLMETIDLMDRQDELLSSGALCDLCWSDPDNDIENWRENERGAGWIFGARQVQEFCHNNKIDLITRSHQLAANGYQWFFEEHLITVWSAPNYMYRAGNKATVLKYDRSAPKEFSLIFFDACPNDKRKIPEDITVSQYFL